MAKIPRYLLWVWRLSAWWHGWNDPYVKAPKLYAAMKAELVRRRHAEMAARHAATPYDASQSLANLAGYQNALGGLSAYQNMPTQYGISLVDPRGVWFDSGTSYQSL